MPMNDVEIIHGDIQHIERLHKVLDFVAKERIYIEMVEAPSLEKVRALHEQLILSGGPVFYAMKDEEVVGWCDVIPEGNPRLSHRGGLGMGLLPEFRGRGIGTLLLKETIRQAREFGLEKVELHVYTTNENAIALYKKFGFEEEGIIRKFRKLDDGDYFDCLMMAKLL